MKEKVIVFADQLDGDNVGDFVRCVYCGEKMLIGKGNDKCPKCGTVGMLDWVDDKQECSIEQIEGMGYEVEDMSEEYKDYYVSYSGSTIVSARSEDEACELAANQINLEEINAYKMDKNGNLIGLP